jgi:predicted acylesterase/phospholipase RssA
LSETVQERYVNLVFQGGGVRGIAYTGVLSTMPEWLRITGVGGTSAGALVSALLAIGKRGKELRAILSDPALFSLLRKEDVARKNRIRFKSCWHRIRDFKLPPRWDTFSAAHSVSALRTFIIFGSLHPKISQN